MHVTNRTTGILQYGSQLEIYFSGSEWQHASQRLLSTMYVSLSKRNKDTSSRHLARNAGEIPQGFYPTKEAHSSFPCYTFKVFISRWISKHIALCRVPSPHDQTMLTAFLIATQPSFFLFSCIKKSLKAPIMFLDARNLMRKERERKNARTTPEQQEHKWIGDRMEQVARSSTFEKSSRVPSIYSRRKSSSPCVHLPNSNSIVVETVTSKKIDSLVPDTQPRSKKPGFTRKDTRPIVSIEAPGIQPCQKCEKRS